MIKKINNFFKKEIIISIFLIFLPLLNFINPGNLKQLSFISLWPLFLFSVIICLILISIINIFKKILNKINTKNFYIIISLTYFLLFYYNDFKIFIDSLNPSNPNTLQIINWRYYGEISIFIIVIIISIIIFLNQKYKFFQNFLKTFIVFFIMINFVFIFFGHIKSFFINNLNQEKILSINNIKISKFNEIKNYNIKNNNVYYIIFDGMISLENAKKQNIFFKEDKIQKIKKKIINNNLKYIDNSTANYNLTYLTLASIFYFNSPINEMSLKYKNNNFFFPKLLTLNNQNTLNNILKKHNYNFYYFGNNWNECNNNSINNINCYKPISNNNHIQLIETFLRNTPITPLLNILLKRLFGYDKLQNNAQFFLKNYETIIDEINKKNKSSNNFVFIHAMTPHPPYLDKNCKFNDNKNLTKYSFSYECVINKILKITEFLKTNDPTSIIVFQGDHGWNTSIKSSDNFDENIYTQNPVINGKINQNIKNEIYYRSSIFNAIKAPDKCLENLIKPKNNSNTIKFIFNCLFDYNLVYEANNHYIGFYESEKNYGKVYKIK